MKIIYFVRHGSTAGNETDAYQLYTTPLSEKGFAQAALVAVRFKDIPVDVIISSDMTRAVQTADCIAQVVGRLVVHSEFFTRSCGPPRCVGSSKPIPRSCKSPNT